MIGMHINPLRSVTKILIKAFDDRVKLGLHFRNSSSARLRSVMSLKVTTASSGVAAHVVGEEYRQNCKTRSQSESSFRMPTSTPRNFLTAENTGKRPFVPC